MAHSVPPLPYDYNALEPHIDEQTMRIHHDKHHAAYVNNLNAAIEKHPELAGKSVEDLVKGINTVKNSPAGSIWAVATEIHLVNRLKNDVEPDKTVVTLDPFGCLCSTMFRVSPNHLLWILEGLLDGQVHNQIIVPDDTKRSAKLALDRMLDIH